LSMQNTPDPQTAERPGGGGPYAVACEKLWRLAEQMTLRQVSLEAFFNNFVETYSHLSSLPATADVPSSCRELLSFVTAQIESKWTHKDVEIRGQVIPEYSFDGLEDYEAREIAKAIVDLTYTVTVENAIHLGRDRSPSC
jgi:hypothetical protein